MTNTTKIFLSLLFATFLTILCVSAHSSQDESNASKPSDHGHPNLREKSLIIVKIWCLIIVFLGTFIGGISPCFFKWNDSFLVLGTQFAGGVFLGTAMMHFLSDANQSFEDLITNEYPFAFMLACFGYLLTMFADCVIMYVFRKSKPQDSIFNNGIEEGHPNQKNTNQQMNSALNYSQAGDNTHNLANVTLATTSSLGDTILLITALCFHSVFEGIAIGLSETKPDAWKALWTISLHKIFAAIAMAIALLRMIPDRPTLLCATYAFAFAISTPIGVAIGIIIDQTAKGRVGDWIYATSMGIACGVFLYVSINHLLAKGNSVHSKVGVNTPLYRFLAVTFGVWGGFGGDVLGYLIELLIQGSRINLTS